MLRYPAVSTVFRCFNTEHIIDCNVIQNDFTEPFQDTDFICKCISRWGEHVSTSDSRLKSSSPQHNIIMNSADLSIIKKNSLQWRSCQSFCSNSLSLKLIAVCLYRKQLLFVSLKLLVFIQTELDCIITLKKSIASLITFFEQTKDRHETDSFK